MNARLVWEASTFRVEPIDVAPVLFRGSSLARIALLRSHLAGDLLLLQILPGSAIGDQPWNEFGTDA